MRKIYIPNLLRIDTLAILFMLHAYSLTLYSTLQRTTLNASSFIYPHELMSWIAHDLNFSEKKED